MNVQVSGQDFEGLAEEALGELRPRALEAAGRAAEVVAERMRRLVSGSSSRPGDPPALRSGALRRSIRATRAGESRRGTIGAVVKVGNPIASVLEFGGKEQGRTVDTLGRYRPPRPFVRPALEQTRPHVDQIIAEI